MTSGLFAFMGSRLSTLLWGTHRQVRQGGASLALPQTCLFLPDQRPEGGTRPAGEAGT